MRPPATISAPRPHATRSAARPPACAPRGRACSSAAAPAARVAIASSSSPENDELMNLNY